jgi:sec-independent protein translocase protein TatB
VFGFSFSEVVLIGVVTLVAVGPQRLPGMLKNLAQWIRKLRKMTIEVRQQTGIDEMLKAEGLQGGLNELRGLMRGGGGLGALAASPAPAPYRAPEDPYRHIDIDIAREYPPEGPDALGALPDDLLTAEDSVAEEPPTAPLAEPAPPDAVAFTSEAKPASDAPETAADGKREPDVRPA